jgi:hypothetical protein
MTTAPKRRVKRRLSYSPLQGVPLTRHGVLDHRHCSSSLRFVMKRIVRRNQFAFDIGVITTFHFTCAKRCSMLWSSLRTRVA